MTGNYMIMAKFYIDASDDLNAQNIAYQLIATRFPLACIRWTSRDAVVLSESERVMPLDGISVDIPPEMFAKRPPNQKPGSAGKYGVGIDFFVAAKDRHVAWHLGQRYLEKHFNGCNVFGVSDKPPHHFRQPVSLDGISTDNIPPMPKRDEDVEKDKKKNEKNLFYALGKEDEFGGKEIDY